MASKAKPLAGVKLRAYEAKRDLGADLLKSVADEGRKDAGGCFAQH